MMADIPIPLVQSAASLEQQPSSTPAVTLRAEPGKPRMYSEDDWEAQRSVIKQLYDVENRPLKEVVDILGRTRSFFATERQYKRRISKWGLDKNVKKSEMQAIVRKQQTRIGEDKESAFRVRGREVEPLKIQRWMRQHGDGDGDVLSRSPSSSRPATPSDISCYTPKRAGSDTPLPSFNSNVEEFALNQQSTPLSLPNNSPTRYDSTDFSPGTVTSPLPSPVHPSPRHTDQTSINGYFGSPQMKMEPELHSPRSSWPTPVQSELTPPDEIDKIIWQDQLEASKLSPSNSHIQLYQPRSATQIVTKDDLGGVPSKMAPPRQSRYKEKEEIEYRRRLPELERIYGIDHPAAIDTLGRLATIVAQQGRYEEALPLLRQVARTCQRVYGRSDRRTFEALTDMVILFKVQGKLSSAEALGRSVLAEATTHLGPEDPITMLLATNIASVLTDMCKFDEAEDMQWDLMHRQILSLGLEHRTTVITMRTLAATLMKLGKTEECTKLCLILSPVVEKGTSLDQCEVLNTKDQLACVFGHIRRYQEAEVLQREVFKQRKLLQGMEHPATLCTLANLAETLRQQNKLDESRSTRQEVLKGQTEILGPDHPETLMSLASLARTLLDLGNFDEAKELAIKALKGQEATLGPEHYHSMMSCSLLAKCLDLQNSFVEAFPLYQRVLSGLSKMKGEKSPEVQEISAWYLSMLGKMNQDGMRRMEMTLSRTQMGDTKRL
ncbi:hypothetical protein F5884DRAFT_226365 [Xylogone sp. PMI_703]|nr:hypothetical protein F5884DRAFT_226365 [Xylogone sp. PMI_703]